MTLDEIVSHYIGHYRDHARAEMRFFEIQRSPSQKSGRLEKFTLTATQAILYFDSFASGDRSYFASA